MKCWSNWEGRGLREPLTLTGPLLGLVTLARLYAFWMLQALEKWHIGFPNATRAMKAQAQLCLQLFKGLWGSRGPGGLWNHHCAVNSGRGWTLPGAVWLSCCQRFLALGLMLSKSNLALYIHYLKSWAAGELTLTPILCPKAQWLTQGNCAAGAHPQAGTSPALLTLYPGARVALLSLEWESGHYPQWQGGCLVTETNRKACTAAWLRINWSQAWPWTVPDIPRTQGITWKGGGERELEPAERSSAGAICWQELGSA